MKAKKKVAPTRARSKKSRAFDLAADVLERAHVAVSDAIGKLKAEIAVVESLAAGADELADSEDPQTCRRLRDLAVQIGVAAGDAWKTACALDARVNVER